MSGTTITSDNIRIKNPTNKTGHNQTGNNTHTHDKSITLNDLRIIKIIVTENQLIFPMIFRLPFQLYS